VIVVPVMAIMVNYKSSDDDDDDDESAYRQWLIPLTLRGNPTHRC
jgi:hypothetical protein